MTRAVRGHYDDPPMPASIDVVIVAYNRYDLTDSCLRHLAGQTRPHRVIVVDNGSTDDTRARLASEWPQARVESFDDNRGFAEACNRGVAAGDGEAIVLLNNDVDCRADFLERLIAPLDADPGVGSVAALMLQPGERTIDSFGLVADPTLACFPRLQGYPVEQAGDEHPLLTGPAGTAAAYRRSAWEQVGGLDETIFAYTRTSTWPCGCAAPAGARSRARDAVGVHLGSATHGHRSAWQRRHGGFGRGYLLRRYGVLRSGEALRAVATEATVVAGDLAISRDAAALRGRLAGWRAGARRPRLARPPADAIDGSIGLRDSFALRRGVYGRRAA